MRAIHWLDRQLTAAGRLLRRLAGRPEPVEFSAARRPENGADSAELAERQWRERHPAAGPH